MVTKIFVNLPVKDLNKSKQFFNNLGFSFEPKFTNEQGACLVLGENIFVMLLTESFFKTFINKEISNAHKTTELLLAIDAESREKVDDLVQKAVDSGGSLYREPDDYGWMYSRSFADLDGHQWEVAFMDESKIPLEELKNNIGQ